MLPILSDAQAVVLVDLMRMVETQARENVVLEESSTHWTIRDKLADPQVAVLWVKIKRNFGRPKAEEQLDFLRRRRVILAIMGGLELGSGT